MAYPAAVWSGFFDLVCGGESLVQAAAGVGVSRQGARKRWLQSCPVTIPVHKGAIGGLGPAPVDDPNDPGKDRVAGIAQRRALTAGDRAVIAAGLKEDWSQAKIAGHLGRDRSVISREIARNSGPDGTYHPGLAHRAAHEQRRRAKTPKLVQDPGLRARIESWLVDGWSPGLIARVLRADHPGHDAAARMARVSHETIYQALYVQTRGALRADLHRHLSLKRKARVSRTQTRRAPGLYTEAFTISQRPAEVTDRAVPGHWEGDLIIGAGGGSAIGTLVERSTRFTILLHLPERHDAATVATAMIEQMSRLPDHLRRSITWDRGVEMARYRDIQIQLATQVYFCDPHSPWQRGTNENTNRLLRHWFEKGTDLSVHTATDLAGIAATLNKRPRPTLDLQTPAQRMAQLLASAA